jgi:secretion/DNA translocation related TadE-like protein
MVDRGDARSERGFATVWALSWMAVCLTLGEVSLLAAAAVAAQHHLDGSADLAALAAAARLQSGGDPCSAAGATANDNAVELIACRHTGPDVEVTMATTLRLPAGIAVRLRSVARAGP